MKKQHTSTFSTGLPDFQKCELTILKITLISIKLRQIFYRNYEESDWGLYNKEIMNVYEVQDTSVYLTLKMLS